MQFEHVGAVVGLIEGAFERVYERTGWPVYEFEPYLDDQGDDAYTVAINPPQKLFAWEVGEDEDEDEVISTIAAALHEEIDAALNGELVKVEDHAAQFERLWNNR